MEITYNTNIKPTADQVIELYENCGLPRPTNDKARMQTMIDNSDLFVTAWDGGQLVGVSRCITDWVWTCYLADLAVNKNYKQSGIGKKLIELTRERVGEQAMILLLSVPEAIEYYPKMGFTKQESCFFIGRSR